MRKKVSKELRKVARARYDALPTKYKRVITPKRVLKGVKREYMEFKSDKTKTKAQV